MSERRSNGEIADAGDLVDEVTDYLEKNADWLGKILSRKKIAGLRAAAQRLRALDEERTVDVWIRPDELSDLVNDNLGSAIVEMREDEDADGHLEAILIIQGGEK